MFQISVITCNWDNDTYLEQNSSLLKCVLYEHTDDGGGWMRPSYTVPNDCKQIIVVTTSNSSDHHELGCGVSYSGRKEEYAVSYNKNFLDGQYRVNIAIFENPKKGDTINTVAAGWGTVSIFMQ